MPPISSAPPRRHHAFMRKAIALALKAAGNTSPNPIVGAVLVKKNRVIGQGWHTQAGAPHAEIEALARARQNRHSPTGATLYVTLEPCSTRGRTPPCVNAIVNAKINTVVIGAIDPNPRHHGRAIPLLRRAGIRVVTGILARECTAINPAYNHWIVHHTPWVRLKAAMSLDGKIATPNGRSKWITHPSSRAFAMQLRKDADAVLVGVNTILADNPSLTYRPSRSDPPTAHPRRRFRVILDSSARTPPNARILNDSSAHNTILVTTKSAQPDAIKSLMKKCTVWIAPTASGRVSLPWLLQKLGRHDVTNLLVEGGGEVLGTFLDQKLAHAASFFYAPKIIAHSRAVKAVSGPGALSQENLTRLHHLELRQLGPDLLLTATLSH